MCNIKEYLDNGKCFKLICGAGNQNIDEITNLCALYAKAGCRFFDVNASIEAVKAAKKGLKIAQKENECFICISVGTKNDPHFLKFSRNKEKCIQCGKCIEICPQNAIDNEQNCIGCAKCKEICTNEAIESHAYPLSLDKILPPLIKEGIHCIEYHTITDNESEVMSGWEIITQLYDGALSVCLDRSKLGNEKFIQRLKTLKETCKNLFIIQADGAPMSGTEDDYRTTLQAVATADLVNKANITPYIFLSGGTNSKTVTLARQCSIAYTGIAAGSYARKKVKDYITQENFLSNEKIFNNALEEAKKIVDIMNE